MSIRDGDRLPRRRILTGSDLMIVGDRMPGKRYNGFIKSLRKESKVVQTKKQYGDFSLTALSFASISIFSG